MCDIHEREAGSGSGVRTIPVHDAVGMVLAHDITEIKKDEFKGRAFRKGHVVTQGDIDRLRKLGKDHLFVLTLGDDEMHEDDAAYAVASALMGKGVVIEGEPKEGKINFIAAMDGIVKINKDALTRFNMAGEVMCATLHNNTVVKKGRVVGGTRAIPLVIKKRIIDEVTTAAKEAGGILEVKEMRKPKAGVVITGNEVYYGRIKDAFAPIITKKIEEIGGEITGIYYAPDNEDFIEARLRDLMEAGADLLITTGGMSVDPDDVTRFAVRRLGADFITYGSAVLPGAMFLVAWLGEIPVLGIPACGMYHRTTVFDLILPRVLAGEKIGRRELAELGHGGMCLNCEVCRYPVCPFGK
jgi:molybdenum cofactor synthesis domain-containing protein